MSVSIPCGLCPSEIVLGALTCPGCGRPVNEADQAVLQVRLEAGDFAAHERGKRVRQGSKWVGALAILFLISGPVVFAMQKSEADKTLVQLAGADEDERYEVGGKPYTAAELRTAVEAEPLRALIANLVLAAIMAALWMWARRAPLPAIACALAVYIVVQVVNAVLDPSTIYKGIIIKLIATGALISGLRAALAAREAMRRRPA